MIPRIVLDTNILVSALLKPQGQEARVLRLGLTGKLLLCISPEVLAEYARVLQAPKFKLRPEEITTTLEQVQRVSVLFPLSQTLQISTHEPDNRFYQCAEAAQADFIITGNLKHFKKDHKTTRVVNARQVLDLLATGQV